MDALSIDERSFSPRAARSAFHEQKTRINLAHALLEMEVKFLEFGRESSHREGNFLGKLVREEIYSLTSAATNLGHRRKDLQSILVHFCREHRPHYG